MDSEHKNSYRFKSFLLNVSERQLFDSGNPVRLTPKAFDLLVYLVRRAGHLVGKDELMRAIWPDSFVEEGNLTRTIHALRKALGEDDNGSKFIETVPTKGYRFVARIDDPIATFSNPHPAEPADGINAEASEDAESSGVENAGGYHSYLEAPKNVARMFQQRAVLIGAIGFILAVLVTGLWFAGDLSKRVAGARRLIPHSGNSVAYECYRQGRLFIERRRKGDLENALASFETAIELDPNYAAAYVGKADAKIMLFWGSQSHDDISQARTAINKAIELDETSSYAHTLLCRIKGTYDWDFDGAEKECLKATELDPKDHEAQREIALLLNVFGREKEALAAIDKAIALAPTSFNKRARGTILYYSRRYDEAIAQFEQIETTDPDFSEADRLDSWLIRAYEMKKDYPRAVEAYIRQRKLAGGADKEVASIMTAFAEKGWPGVLKSMIEPSRENNVNAAAVYAQLGDKERALEVLNRLVKRRAIMLIHSAREPRFDPLRDDPRFSDLLRQIGLR